jgi:CheY-like chemotaxis protein
MTVSPADRGGAPGGNGHSPVVLLVEDDPDSRLLYAAGLEQAGYRVEQAHNGNQALSKAFELLPSAIVTDLALPGMDGFELCRQLRRDGRTRHIPLVAVTGYGGFVADTSRATSAGADAVLTKPCAPEALAAELERLLAPSARNQSR